MIKIKKLIKEVHDVETLRPRDVFNFYYLWHTAVNQPQLVETPYGEEVMGYYLAQFKEKYVRLFTRLVIKQLSKYVARNRVDPDFPRDQLTVGTTPLKGKELAGLMKKTFRSDMQRRNDRWNEVADAVANLETSKSPKDIFLWINQLNNAVHNTQTKMLDKFPNYYSELKRAFDVVDRATNIEMLKTSVDKDIRDLQDQEVQAESNQPYQIAHGRYAQEAGATPLTEGDLGKIILKTKRDKIPLKKRDFDLYDATYGSPKRIPPNRPPDKPIKPMIKLDEPKPEKTPKYEPFLEESNTVRVSKADRHNIIFMTGLKQAVQDKTNNVKRNLRGDPEDFVRGYEMVKRDSWWNKFNNKLTQWASDFGHSYGKRF
jgi:hypothetical protein